MKLASQTIIGIIALVLVLVHLTVIGLFFCPVPRLVNIALDQKVEYAYLAEIPSHVNQVFVPNNKLIVLPTDDNLVRRLASKVLNVRQEKFFDQNEYHEFYLNTLDFGGDVIGVAAASNYYFQKPIYDLGFEESLTLASLYKIFDK